MVRLTQEQAAKMKSCFFVTFKYTFFAKKKKLWFETSKASDSLLWVKMAKTGVFVCLMIVLVDFTAGFLSIQEHITKDKMRHMNAKRFECRKPKNKAFKLGLIASVLLALSHVSANLFGGCMCICCTEKLEKSSANRKFWFGCLVLSWIAVAVGFPALVMGMLEISKSKGACQQILHHHCLLVGGILSFVHGVLSVGFYVSANVSFEKDMAIPP